MKFAYLMMCVCVSKQQNLTKSQAVCFSGKPSLNYDQKNNNWSTPVSFCRGPGFDVGDKKRGEDRIAGLSIFPDLYKVHI